jgi:hypothetical protein
MPRTVTKKLILCLSIAAALGCASTNTLADGDPVDALEARIAELEALVQELLADRQAPPPADCCIDMDAKVEAQAKAAADAAIAEYKAEEADVIYSDFSSDSYSGAGRDFYIPATVRVGNGSGEAYTDMHAKESRINFKSNHLLDSGAKMSTFFEMDFMLSGQGDERISNSYAPRVRHAFFTYNKWLFGQTWMTFFNVGALPENLDFVGPAESTVFGRQTMIRYTNGPWQFAIENPETTVTGYQGDPGRIVADDSKVPDFVARYNASGDWGSFTIAGILRQLRYDANTPGGASDSVSGYGVSVSGKFNIGDKDDFRWMVTTGKGLGRYIGLNTANGAVIDANGNLEAIDQTGAFGSFRHFWSEKWRSNLTLGYLTVDNDTSLTGVGATKNASSMHVNLIYSPQPKLDFGVELLLADREIESGADGDLTRLQFSAKYAY